jgi:carboxymethylenebutenolidase
MKAIRKEDIEQEIFDLYDDYAHNRIDRRGFMEKISVYAVGGLTVNSILKFILPNYKDNIQIPANDPRLKSTMIEYDSPKGGGTISGLLSMPKEASERLPGIVVVHENRGLNPYIEDVGRRAALEGFITLAPDALSPLGGYPGNDDEGREMQRKRDRNEMLEDFIAAFYFLKNHHHCTGKVGVVGFCFGGWISNMMAVRLPELDAAVPFYGRQPSAEETAKIMAPIMLHYAELDTRVNQGWPEYKRALQSANIDFEMFMYSRANHGFHNNTTPRYDEDAAVLAWERTMVFFKNKLHP